MARGGWSPLSVLLFVEPRTYASAFVLRRLLAGGQSIPLLYGGDRMHGAVSHGERFRVFPLGDGRLPCGLAVIAMNGAVPELLRVLEDKVESVVLVGDADRGAPETIARASILARADLPLHRPQPRWRRAARRLRLDLAEAIQGARLLRGAGAESVRAKYDEQAAVYASHVDQGTYAGVLGALRAGGCQKGRVLVAGCGAGGECFALARTGYEVTGVDFSAPMLEHARSLARDRNLDVRFVESDLTKHEEQYGTVDAVVFTPDVYSFVPERSARVNLLRSIRTWLRDPGLVLLSARRTSGTWAWSLLLLEWLAASRAPDRILGATHTRWIAPDGAIARSFVQVFSDAALQREIRAGGFVLDCWEAGVALLRPK